jgi:hypothetical protein
LYSSNELNIANGVGTWRPIPRERGRIVAVMRDPNTKRVVHGWEDAPDGLDSDYNDVVYMVASNCALDYTMIPCAGVTTCRNPLQLLC